MIRILLWAIGLWFGVELLFLAALFGQAAWEERHRGRVERWSQRPPHPSRRAGERLSTAR